MNYLLSPPSSPRSDAASLSENHVTCGTCNEALGADWFCPSCHIKCHSCNRFLSQNEYCSRCWSFDAVSQQFLRKDFTSSLMHYYQSASSSNSSRQHHHHHHTIMLTALPSPSNSTGSDPK